MNLIEKLQRLSERDLDLIGELFDSITHMTVYDIYSNLMHSRSECLQGADAFMKLQEMDDAVEAESTADKHAGDRLSDTWMLRLAYLALCENEHATVPGHPDCRPPFNQPYDTTKLLQMMEKQKIHIYGH